MSRIAVDAELQKLAQTLELEREALSFCEEVPAEQLRALRISIYERLYEEDRKLFERVAWIVGHLPAGLAAAAAERAGPLLTARAAAEMPASVGAALAMRIPARTLADACLHLDPRRTRDMLLRLPHERVVEVARLLVADGEYMTMSRFVDFISDEAIRAVEAALPDEGDLLRIAFFMGSKNRVNHLFEMLPEERRRRMIVRVEEEADELLAPFLSLLIHVSYALKRELGDLAAEQDQRVLDGFVRAAHEMRLWADMLPVVAAMSPSARQRVVNLPILGELEVQERVIEVADEHRLWGIVLPMIGAMQDDNREAVAMIVARRPRATLAQAADAALLGEQWQVLFDLVRRMPADARRQFAEIVDELGAVDPELVERLRDLDPEAFSEPASRAAG